MSLSNDIRSLVKRIKESLRYRLNLQPKHNRIKKIPDPNDADLLFLKRNYLGTYHQKIRERDRRLCKVISPDQTVLTGPFKGLKYPSLDIKEFSLVSKIVGSYESELHNVIRQISNTKYDEIINVGCAEGYYAVGLARNIAGATVYAYDIDQYSLEVCREMAKANQVEDRMRFRERCSAESLAEFQFKGKTLIVSDCEGAELDLFTEKSISNLNTCDLLIEMHDPLIPGVTSAILTRFSPTHNLQVFSTQDKPVYDYPELSMLSDSEKKIALCDNRGEIGKVVFMEWAWLTPKEKA
jgi:hypothetical protein